VCNVNGVEHYHSGISVICHITISVQYCYNHVDAIFVYWIYNIYVRKISLQYCSNVENQYGKINIDMRLIAYCKYLHSTWPIYPYSRNISPIYILEFLLLGDLCPCAPLHGCTADQVGWLQFSGPVWTHAKVAASPDLSQRVRTSQELNPTVSPQLFPHKLNGTRLTFGPLDG